MEKYMLMVDMIVDGRSRWEKRMIVEVIFVQEKDMKGELERGISYLGRSGVSQIFET